MKRFVPILAIACSEYNIQEQKETLPVPEPVPEEEPTHTPLIAVEPSEITALDICMAEAHDITLFNLGEGDLIIDDISFLGSGWSVESVALPLVVGPNSSRSLQVFTEGNGSGVLSIRSNDSQQPDIWVDLFSTLDTPPIVSILDPLDNSVIPVGGQMVNGIVSDNSPAQDLILEWVSSVDGLFNSDPASTDGSSSTHFSGSTPGSQELSLLATDSCGNVSLDVVTVCQQAGYDVENLSINSWNFEGTALWDSSNSWVELTGPYTNQAGTAFNTTAAVSAENVDIEFLFYVSGGSGADGISLTALDTTRMNGFVGSSGGGIGYMGMPGWSIEVDTYQNNHDPPQDHIAFVFDGQIESPQVVVTVPELEDNQWHTLKVSVAAPHVLVELDGVVYIDQNINGHFAFPAYVGFTAATGSLTNFHLIDSLVVTEMVCEE